MSIESYSGGEDHESLLQQQRLLTEVNHLLRHRVGPMQFEDSVLNDVYTNLVTAVQEAAMPYAVTTTAQELVINPETNTKTFMWLGKTAVQNAMSGYVYHKHSAAHKRVDIEVDEARYATENVAEQVARVFISPKMTRKDASEQVAKSEHLKDDDAVRVSWLETDASGKTRRILQSLLVRDIPLNAWTAMLQDPYNIFGKSIHLDDTDSALSVMKVHRQLELPLYKLSAGPVSLLQAVLPYIHNPTERSKLEARIALYSGDQQDMKQKAEYTADKWLEFEASLAESLHTGTATSEISQFIVSFQDYWNGADLAVVLAHSKGNAQFAMTHKLAAVLEHAKQNVLWGRAAVSVKNESVAAQINPAVLEQIRINEELIRIAQKNNIESKSLELENDKLVAGQNIEVGAGCSGSNAGRFKDDKSGTGGDGEENKKDWKWKQGICQVKVCATRPGKTEVGPCSVCRKCQAVFDKGGDPTKTGIFAQKESKPEPPKQEVVKEMYATNEQFATAA